MNETLAAAMGPPASSVAPMKPPRLEVLEEGVQQNGGDHLQGIQEVPPPNMYLIGCPPPAYKYL